MTTKHDQLRKTIDNIINQDTAGAASAFAPYVHAMTREILGYAPETDLSGPIEEVPVPHTDIDVIPVEEGVDLNNINSPIRLHGDKVLVNGKEIGVVTHDIVNEPDSFTFTPADGSGGKLFDSVTDLYDWVSDKYIKTSTN